MIVPSVRKKAPKIASFFPVTSVTMVRWQSRVCTSEYVDYSPIRLRVGTTAIVLRRPRRMASSCEIMLPDGSICVVRDIYMKNLTLLQENDSEHV